MVMFGDVNAGRIDGIYFDNISSEYVDELRYLGTTVTK